MARQVPKYAAAAPAARFVDDYLSYLLARASHLVSADFHAQLTALGVAAPTWRVLSTLFDSNGLTVGELAKIVLLKQPTLSKALDRMIADGLVSRAASAADRRQVRVSITSKGRAMIEGLIARAIAHEESVLSSYSAAERQTLKQMLKTLIERLSEVNHGEL